MAAKPAEPGSSFCRVLLISRQTRSHGVLETAARPDVLAVVWPESRKSDEPASAAFLSRLRDGLRGRRVESVAIVAPTSQASAATACVELDAQTKVRSPPDCPHLFFTFTDSVGVWIHEGGVVYRQKKTFF